MNLYQLKVSCIEKGPEGSGSMPERKRRQRKNFGPGSKNLGPEDGLMFPSMR